jgi:chromosome segregation ATPase
MRTIRRFPQVRTQSQLRAATDHADEERARRIRSEEEVAQLRALMETKDNSMTEVKGQLNKEVARANDLEAKLASHVLAKTELEERLSASNVECRSAGDQVRTLQAKMQVRI